MKLTGRQQKVLNYCAQHDVMRSKDGCAHLGFSTLGDVSEVLRALLAKGLVERVRHGRYSITDAGKVQALAAPPPAGALEE